MKHMHLQFLSLQGFFQLNGSLCDIVLKVILKFFNSYCDSTQVHVVYGYILK